MEEKLVFNPITLDCAERINRLRTKSGHVLYSHTFTTLFTWQQNMRLSIAFLREAFVVKDGERGKNAYLFPCGADVDKLAIIRSLLPENPVFYYAREEDTEFLRANFGGAFLYEECRDDSPYLYDKKSQLELSGGEYKKLRKKVNSAEKFFNWKVERITENNLSRVHYVLGKWYDEGHGDAIDREETARAIDNFRAIGMEGCLFGDGKEDYAFILGSYTSPEIFDMNIEKTLVSDIDCYINREFFRLLPDSVKLIDMEDDMGHAGLRQSKLVKCPIRVEKVYCCKFVSDKA